MALPKQINSFKFKNKIRIDPKFEKLPLFNLIIILIIINLIILVIGLISKLILPPQIPIFFGLPQTEEQLGPSILIIMPTAICLAFILINTYVATKIENNYIKKALVFGSLAITLLSTIAILKIIFLVGSL